MLYQIKKQANLARFNYFTKSIFDTPPIQLVDAPWSIVTMVADSDVQMYLLSMKSFYSRLGRGKLIAIIDRSMPNRLREILQTHFIGIQFVTLEDIDSGTCQRGGTWERLVYLLDHSRSEYAIQVDCDTLAFGPDLAEIIDCAQNNRPFTLSNGGRPIETMRETAANARTVNTTYVGIRAERLYDRYPNCDQLKYVRGSSGLAGFAKGGFTRGQIEDYHAKMEALIGFDDWRKWGTEQCASNFAVANSPGAVVLPHPKYANFQEGTTWREAQFLHYIGSFRFLENHFADKGRQIISELMAKTAAA